ncbi:MAG: stage III sporulation protein AA [Eubacterium sp.]|jgi:stage III sporulation protein AA|nr:stage III sporulation protein AA [Eubacterium sp.]
MKQEILHIMPMRLRGELTKSLKYETGIEEIRVRIGRPLEIRFRAKSFFLEEPVTAADIEEMLTFISRYSIYAYEDEIRQGYLTIEGGSRIGFAGQVRLLHGQVDRMTNIRFLNIRIANEQKGCAKQLLPWLFADGEFLNTLLVSKPGIGKTTLLRDCIRLLSDGYAGREGRKICVIDERSEIAACHLGIPQNDVGIRTDVLDGGPKTEGMRMALRSMSPEIIAVDELGGIEDAKAVREMALSGCKILGTIHGDAIDRVTKTEGVAQMYRQKLFQRYILLKRETDGKRAYFVFDEVGKRLC